MTEAEMDALEARIPALAAEAGVRAYRRALETGSVLIARDGALVEVFPDGTETVIRTLSPPVKVTPGTVIHARHRPPA